MKFIRFIRLTLTILLALATVLAVLAPYISPNDFWPLAFFGLAFPFLFLFNLLFFILWAIRKNKGAFISLTALLISLVNFPSYLQIHGREPKGLPESNLLNIVSFNTHYMGAYDYKGKDTGFFLHVLNQLQPDIICFQEFANLGGNYEKPMFKEFLKQYENFANVNADAINNTFPTGYGVCIFSRYPIVKKGYLELENQNSNLSVFADIVVGHDTIRIVNTHLKSIVFDKEDYKTYEKLKEAEESPESGKFRRIFSKLKLAFQSRARQADKIRERLLKCPYKIILCGDFNDVPTSYAYHTIRENRKDAFKESGWGLSRTYIGKMPSFRIDYILHDPSWNSYRYKTHKLNFSDHKMISCSIDLGKK